MHFQILRLNSVIQMRDVQFQNDIRKRDIQIDKLKDKLTLFMNDGNIRKSGKSLRKQNSKCILLYSSVFVNF